MPDVTRWLIFHAVLGLCLPPALGKLKAEELRTSSDRILDTISQQAATVFDLYEKSIGAEDYTHVSDGGSLAWGHSYLMLAYETMFEGTGDERYLQALLHRIEAALANRADRLGLKDEVRGKIMPAWVSTGYGRPHAFLVHAGMITYPMARCVAVLRRDPSLAARHAKIIDKILSDVAQTIQAYEPEYREGPDEGEGYYYCPDLKRDMPYNQQNALGRTMLAMYLATGDKWYLNRVEKLARYFKARLWPMDGRYVWEYWTHRTESEDISHAGTNVDFVFNCYRAGIVFAREDMERFVGTLEYLASRPDGLAGNVDGTGRGSVLIGTWAHLGYIGPKVRQILGDYLSGHHKENGHIAMLAAGYLVESQRPLQMEQPVTIASPMKATSQTTTSATTQPR